eukprot:TRINITY_DN8543_c0_g1_i2.p1 TRINITY_DN8543_c0_g1~~TRINITY_DN8543_c0_g1_i2.p1  ORF type:complete len:279 (+),score=34.04 TRINITY_DN8543_c0_g1_i2:71-907(+)
MSEDIQRPYQKGMKHSILGEWQKNDEEIRHLNEEITPESILSSIKGEEPALSARRLLQSMNHNIPNAKGGLHQCRFSGCERTFTTSTNRNRHEKLHSGERPFICNFGEDCKKSFARKYDLQVHLRSHTKDRPYKCDAAGCDKAFTRSSSLKEHEKAIHGIEKMGVRKRVKLPPVDDHCIMRSPGSSQLELYPRSPSFSSPPQSPTCPQTNSPISPKSSNSLTSLSLPNTSSVSLRSQSLIPLPSPKDLRSLFIQGAPSPQAALALLRSPSPSWGRRSE